jgi:hypothetical protein
MGKAGRGLIGVSIDTPLFPVAASKGRPAYLRHARKSPVSRANF